MEHIKIAEVVHIRRDRTISITGDSPVMQIGVSVFGTYEKSKQDGDIKLK